MKQNGFLCLFISALLFTPSFALGYSPLNALTYYPTKDSDWKIYNSVSEAGFDKDKFKKFVEYTFQNKGFQTDSLLVVKDGKIVFERYSDNINYTKDTPHMLWSFSKSLTNGILGVAERKGILSRETKLSEYYPDIHLLSNNSGDARDIKISNLMQMSSGLRYYEEHPDLIILSSSIYLQYSWLGYRNMVDFMLNPSNRKMIARPGAKFNYSTGDCLLSAGILKEAIFFSNPNNRLQEYRKFIYSELFDKIGMSNTLIEQDGSGTILTCSSAYGTPRDIAKYALLFLNDGVWDVDGNGSISKEERLLPKGWVKDSIQTIAPSLMNPNLVEEEQLRLNREAYGNFWWLNKKLPMNNKRPYPNLPENAFLALGYRGQTLAVLPDEGIVIVRLASDGSVDGLGGKIDRNKFFKLFSESMGNEGILWEEEHRDGCGGLFCIGDRLIKSDLTLPSSKNLLLTNSFNESKNGKDEYKFFSQLLEEFYINDGLALGPARDICSCVFVSEQEEDSCKNLHFQYRFLRDYNFIDRAKIDYKKKSVSVSNYAIWFIGLLKEETFTATYVNDKVGCMISEVKEEGLRGLLFSKEAPCVDYFGNVRLKENGACERVF